MVMLYAFVQFRLIMLYLYIFCLHAFCVDTFGRCKGNSALSVRSLVVFEERVKPGHCALMLMLGDR